MMKNYILIDDDELVRMTWSFKSKANDVSLATFSSAKDFKDSSQLFSKDTPIYLDSELGDVLGEEFITELIEMGFIEIHLVTGKDPDQIKINKELFKSIGGKEPPF